MDVWGIIGTIKYVSNDRETFFYEQCSSCKSNNAGRHRGVTSKAERARPLTANAEKHRHRGGTFLFTFGFNLAPNQPSSIGAFFIHRADSDSIALIDNYAAQQSLAALAVANQHTRCGNYLMQMP